MHGPARYLRSEREEGSQKPEARSQNGAGGSRCGAFGILASGFWLLASFFSYSLSNPHQLLKKRNRAGFALRPDGGKENAFRPGNRRPAHSVFHIEPGAFSHEECDDFVRSPV